LFEDFDLVKSLCSFEFILDSSSPFDGIISYLTRKHSGNVHDRGIVIITPTEPYDDSSKWAVQNAAELTVDSYFCSKNDQNQWRYYDFSDCRIKLTHYSIQSQSNSGTDQFALKVIGAKRISRSNKSREMGNVFSLGFVKSLFSSE
jgi:hypothetical protein